MGPRRGSGPFGPGGGPNRHTQPRPTRHVAGRGQRAVGRGTTGGGRQGARRAVHGRHRRHEARRVDVRHRLGEGRHRRHRAHGQRDAALPGLSAHLVPNREGPFGHAGSTLAYRRHVHGTVVGDVVGAARVVPVGVGRSHSGPVRDARLRHRQLLRARAWARRELLGSLSVEGWRIELGIPPREEPRRCAGRELPPARTDHRDADGGSGRSHHPQLGGRGGQAGGRSGCRYRPREGGPAATDHGMRAISS